VTLIWCWWCSIATKEVSVEDRELLAVSGKRRALAVAKSLILLLIFGYNFRFAGFQDLGRNRRRN